MSTNMDKQTQKSCFSKMTDISQIASKRDKLPERSKIMAKKTIKSETAFTAVGRSGLVVYWDTKHAKASFDVQYYPPGLNLTYGDIRRLLQRAFEATLDKADDAQWDSAFISASDMIKKLHLREAVADLEKAQSLHRTEEDEQDD